MGVPIQDVLLTVFQSILQVFLLCLAGFVLSFKGIVDKPSSKVLNHINVALCTPALLFSKVAYFLSPAKLRQLWVIPVFFLLVTALSAVVAHCLARACRLQRHQVNFATAASMFMNSNSLPVALMQSLATTVPLLKWGPEDTVDAMFGRSLTYLVVFSTLGMILRWSYGVHLLAQVDQPESISTYRDVDPPLSHVSVKPSTPLLVDYETEPEVDRYVWRTRPVRSRLPHPRLTSLSRRLTYPHVRHSHLPAVPTSLGDRSESDDSDDTDTTEGDSEDTIALRSDPIDTEFATEAEDHATVLTSTPLPPSSLTDATPQWDRSARPSPLMRLLNALTSLSPPLLASLFALFCVLVPQIQRVLKSEQMISFKSALDSVGACSIPLTMLVLGGWFWDGESDPKRKHPRVDDHDKSAPHGQGNANGKGKSVETHSRESSTASLPSSIGAVGNVLIEHVYPHRGAGTDSARTRRRVDVEAGPQLATHTETESECDGDESRSRSRTRARPAPAHENPPGETLTVIVTLLSRMVLVPLVATPLMVLIGRLGWGGQVFEDPVFIVSSMLLIASPPALTLAQISQRAKPAAATTVGTSAADADAISPFERLLSRTVFWAYLVLTPPLTIVSIMVGLLMIEA